MNKIYNYDGIGETLALAESLGWIDPPIDDPKFCHHGDPDPDEVEASAVEYLRAAGWLVLGYDEVPA